MIIQPAPSLSEAMTIFFDKDNQPNERVQMGVVVLQPGEKRPLTGFARHEQDEYSYIVSGKAHTILEDGRDLIGQPGEAQLIEAGEGHINYNDGEEPAVVVWLLVERQ
jgi:quercetin dioxygenase-like cupin family protein